MKAIFFLLFLLPMVIHGQNQKQSSTRYHDDFNFFWTTIQDEYCYFDKKQTDWPKVKTTYAPIADTITHREQFISLLEKVFCEIYDHHASLNTNTDLSQKMVPSSTDIWAEYSNNRAIITEIKHASNAEKNGMAAGMEISAFNNISIDEAIKPFLGSCVASENNEMKSYALRLLLAGNHIQHRKITAKINGKTADYFPEDGQLPISNFKEIARIESSVKQGIGYISINDCLYDNALIPEFDQVMKQMKTTKSLVLDLRNTPSGGNTTVAKAILGWFIDQEHFYQKHEYTAEEKATGIKRSWMEIVSPRTGLYYGKPLVILADHWTGSVGEAIVIGFDALNRPKTKIIGTKLARLNGAISTFEMPDSKIKFSFPNEKLFHINGKPRELFEPVITIDLIKEKPTAAFDPFMLKATQYLNSVTK
ncbi:S41 family peptidase [Flavobacterium sp.]|uniref:S41 family peptidase n=1 Tax=Flavobacterium sp. TaxID=239 RepID=UPI00286C66E7|nr:S41 family peptidase [Flavobacterium sp.]